MKKTNHIRFLFVLFFLSLVFTGCLSGNNGWSNLPPLPYTVSGTVTSGDLTNFLAGASVILINNNTNRQAGSDITGADGKYAIGVPSGTYTIEVSRFGYITGKSPAFTVSDANIVRDMELEINMSNPTAIFPRSSTISAAIDTLNFEFLPSKGHKLAAVSLQGLVNRNKPQIYLMARLTSWQLFYLRQRGYVTDVTNHNTDLMGLINKYKDRLSGAVIYDPAKEFTVNTATNIAGVQNRIIISPDMVTGIRALGITDILDLRTMNFRSISDAYEWELAHCLPYQSKDALSVYYYSDQTDYGRDYMIAHTIHTFWLPGNNDPEYDSRIRNLVEDMLSKQKHNIPVLGFWAAVASGGQQRGITEYGGVTLGGYYGKYTVVSDWSGNYSFNSGVPVDESKYVQRTKSFREYDPNAKYVALIMIESGDSPGYIQYHFTQNQWDDPYRGSVPISYGITMTLRYLAPFILELMYDTMTPNEYFFTSISGIGYCYPLEGYGSKGAPGVSSAVINREYFEWTAQQMADLDLTMMGLYSHPFSAWQNPADDNILNTYVTVQPQIQSIIADMGRNDGPTTANPNRMLQNDVTIHHTLTRWPMTNMGEPSSTAQDNEAVQHLADQIRTYGNSPNNQKFIQAMFYSWFYGPRRLKMVQDLLEAEGYTFVTLDEFDYLYRISRH